jgi:hypothetical protein
VNWFGYFFLDLDDVFVYVNGFDNQWSVGVNTTECRTFVFLVDFGEVCLLIFFGGGGLDGNTEQTGPVGAGHRYGAFCTIECSDINKWSPNAAGDEYSEPRILYTCSNTSCSCNGIAKPDWHGECERTRQSPAIRARRKRSTEEIVDGRGGNGDCWSCGRDCVCDARGMGLFCGTRTPKKGRAIATKPGLHAQESSDEGKNDGEKTAYITHTAPTAPKILAERERKTFAEHERKTPTEDKRKTLAEHERKTPTEDKRKKTLAEHKRKTPAERKRKKPPPYTRSPPNGHRTSRPKPCLAVRTDSKDSSSSAPELLLLLSASGAGNPPSARSVMASPLPKTPNSGVPGTPPGWTRAAIKM